MDALVIGGSVRRPVRFVMDHSIFKIPVLGFIFRTARAIPIAPAREDPDALQKAFDRIDAELADGEVVCIFPEGKLTRDGEMNEFKRGVEKILERRPVPVMPMALRGLWGSFFSRRGGKAAMTPAAQPLLVAHRAGRHGARARQRRQRHGPAENRRRPARRMAVRLDRGASRYSLESGQIRVGPAIPRPTSQSPTSSAPSPASATPCCATRARRGPGPAPRICTS